MNPFCYDYAVIGGDLRKIYLIEELAKENNNLCHYALCQPMQQTFPANQITAQTSIEAAITNSRHIICPIPLSKNSDTLNQSGIKRNIPLKQILSLLTPGQYFFAGCIPKTFRQEALKKDVFVFDFMKDSELSYFNTIATAEGVICEAIKASPMNLHKSRCAVLGYGKCGRILTDDLKRMFCYVTVVSSCKEELAQAVLSADDTLDLSSFFTHIGEYDFIFNTIPAIILTKETLTHVNPQTRILDIASAPGGVDFAAAKELHIPAVFCPGLPGKYAPLSSARAIFRCLYKYQGSANIH